MNRLLSDGKEDEGGNPALKPVPIGLRRSDFYDKHGALGDGRVRTFCFF